MSIWDKEGEPEPEGLSQFELRELRDDEDWDVTTDDRLVLHCRHPKHQAWAVKAIFEVDEDDVRLSHLTIYPAGHWAPPGGLTDEVRRSVPLDELRKMARRRLQLREAAASVGVDPSKFEGIKRRGRKGRSELDLAKIASDYVRLLGDGTSAAHALATEMGLNVTTVRGLVWQARKKGFLTPAPRGQEGGQLTGRAESVLNGAH